MEQVEETITIKLMQEPSTIRIDDTEYIIIFDVYNKKYIFCTESSIALILLNISDCCVNGKVAETVLEINTQSKDCKVLEYPSHYKPNDYDNDSYILSSGTGIGSQFCIGCKKECNFFKEFEPAVIEIFDVFL